MLMTSYLCAPRVMTRRAGAMLLLLLVVGTVAAAAATLRCPRAPVDVEVIVPLRRDVALAERNGLHATVQSFVSALSLPTQRLGLIAFSNATSTLLSLDSGGNSTLVSAAVDSLLLTAPAFSSYAYTTVATAEASSEFTIHAGPFPRRRLLLMLLDRPIVCSDVVDCSLGVTSTTSLLSDPVYASLRSSMTAQLHSLWTQHNTTTSVLRVIRAADEAALPVDYVAAMADEAGQWTSSTTALLPAVSSFTAAAADSSVDKLLERVCDAAKPQQILVHPVGELWAFLPMTFAVTPSQPVDISVVGLDLLSCIDATTHELLLACTIQDASRGVSIAMLETGLVNLTLVSIAHSSDMRLVLRDDISNRLFTAGEVFRVRNPSILGVVVANAQYFAQTVMLVRHTYDVQWTCVGPEDRLLATEMVWSVSAFLMGAVDTVVARTVSACDPGGRVNSLQYRVPDNATLSLLHESVVQTISIQLVEPSMMPAGTLVSPVRRASERIVIAPVPDDFSPRIIFAQPTPSPITIRGRNIGRLTDAIVGLYPGEVCPPDAGAYRHQTRTLQTYDADRLVATIGAHGPFPAFDNDILPGGNYSVCFSHSGTFPFEKVGTSMVAAVEVTGVSPMALVADGRPRSITVTGVGLDRATNVFTIGPLPQYCYDNSYSATGPFNVTVRRGDDSPTGTSVVLDVSLSPQFALHRSEVHLCFRNNHNETSWGHAFVEEPMIVASAFDVHPLILPRLLVSPSTSSAVLRLTLSGYGLAVAATRGVVTLRLVDASTSCVTADPVHSSLHGLTTGAIEVLSASTPSQLTSRLAVSMHGTIAVAAGTQVKLCMRVATLSDATLSSNSTASSSSPWFGEVVSPLSSEPLLLTVVSVDSVSPRLLPSVSAYSLLRVYGSGLVAERDRFRVVQREQSCASGASIGQVGVPSSLDGGGGGGGSSSSVLMVSVSLSAADAATAQQLQLCVRFRPDDESAPVDDAVDGAGVSDAYNWFPFSTVGANFLSTSYTRVTLSGSAFLGFPLTIQWTCSNPAATTLSIYVEDPQDTSSALLIVSNVASVCDEETVNTYSWLVPETLLEETPLATNTRALAPQASLSPQRRLRILMPDGSVFVSQVFVPTTPRFVVIAPAQGSFLNRFETLAVSWTCAPTQITQLEVVMEYDGEPSHSFPIFNAGALCDGTSVMSVPFTVPADARTDGTYRFVARDVPHRKYRGSIGGVRVVDPSIVLVDAGSSSSVTEIVIGNVVPVSFACTRPQMRTARILIVAPTTMMSNDGQLVSEHETSAVAMRDVARAQSLVLHEYSAACRCSSSSGGGVEWTNRAPWSSTGWSGPMEVRVIVVDESSVAPRVLSARSGIIRLVPAPVYWFTHTNQETVTTTRSWLYSNWWLVVLVSVVLMSAVVVWWCVRRPGPRTRELTSSDPEMTELIAAASDVEGSAGFDSLATSGDAKLPADLPSGFLRVSQPVRSHFVPAAGREVVARMRPLRISTSYTNLVDAALTGARSRGSSPTSSVDEDARLHRQPMQAMTPLVRTSVVRPTSATARSPLHLSSSVSAQVSVASPSLVQLAALSSPPSTRPPSPVGGASSSSPHASALMLGNAASSTVSMSDSERLQLLHSSSAALSPLARLLRQQLRPPATAVAPAAEAGIVRRVRISPAATRPPSPLQPLDMPFGPLAPVPAASPAFGAQPSAVHPPPPSQ